MKFLASILLTFSVLICAKGQGIHVPNSYKLDDYPFHFGFCLGVNMMDFIIHPSLQGYQKDSLLADVSTPNLGFQIQIVTNIRLGEYFDLRFLPGIAFGQRNLNFFKNGVLVDSKHKLESNYLVFPLLLKYKAKRLVNFRPYIITGGSCQVDLAKSYNEDQGIYIGLKKLDFCYEAGVGADFYLQFFKLSTELKYSLGLRNIIQQRSSNKPQYELAIAKLNSSIVMISFCFE